MKEVRKKEGAMKMMEIWQELDKSESYRERIQKEERVSKSDGKEKKH